MKMTVLELETDNRRALLSYRFFIACALALFLLIRAMVYYGAFDPANKLDRLLILTFPMSLSGFTPFAVLFPLIPYATSFCDEYNSGYAKFIITRIGVKQYAKKKIVAVGLSGALAIGIPFLIVFVLIAIIGVPTTAANMSDFYYGKIWAPYAAVWGGNLVLAAKLVLGLFFGCMWALVGLAISTVATNRYVVIVGPFILYQALWRLLANLPINPLYMLRGDFGSPGQFIGSYVYILLYQTIWIVLACVAVMFGIRRRVENV
jgi:hypothetical protein